MAPVVQKFPIEKIPKKNKNRKRGPKKNKNRLPTNQEIFSKLTELSDAVYPTQELLNNVYGMLINQQETIDKDVFELIRRSQLKQKKFNEKVLKFQRRQKKFQKEMLKNQNETLEKLFVNQHCISAIYYNITKDKNQKIGRIEPMETENSVDSSEIPTGIPSTHEKSFVLKHVFDDASNMEVGNDWYSPEEDHFGVSWRINVARVGGGLACFLDCSKMSKRKNWSIDTKFQMKFVSKTEKYCTQKWKGSFGNANGRTTLGENKMTEWKELNQDFLINGSLHVEILVEIHKMKGIYPKNSINFDSTMEKFSSGILNVKGNKFYVNRLFLAVNSPYFESLLIDNYQESESSEIKLEGVDGDDFQKFLEVLYGECPMDEIIVEGVLLVAHMYSTPIIIKECEDFLMNQSKKTLKKKLEMATKYNLEHLKAVCISNINSVNDLKSVIDCEMDHPTTAKLLKKSIYFHS